MVSEREMFESMGNCNGEIRVMEGRYGGGWLACGCAVIEWDFDEEWECLVSGDNDYFDSRDFFEDNNNLVLIEHAKTARQAFELCVKQLIETME